MRPCLWPLLLCVGQLVVAAAACPYSETRTLRSGETVVLTGAGPGGCDGAVVFRLPDGAEWVGSSYTFVGVGVLPIFSVANASRVDGIAIAYQDVAVADAAALAAAWPLPSRELVGVHSTQNVSRVTVSFAGVRCSTAAGGPAVVATLVHISALLHTVDVAVSVDRCELVYTVSTIVVNLEANASARAVQWHFSRSTVLISTAVSPLTSSGFLARVTSTDDLVAVNGSIVDCTVSYSTCVNGCVFFVDAFAILLQSSAEHVAHVFFSLRASVVRIATLPSNVSATNVGSTSRLLTVRVLSVSAVHVELFNVSVTLEASQACDALYFCGVFRCRTASDVNIIVANTSVAARIAASIPLSVDSSIRRVSMISFLGYHQRVADVFLSCVNVSVVSKMLSGADSITSHTINAVLIVVVVITAHASDTMDMSHCNISFISVSLNALSTGGYITDNESLAGVITWSHTVALALLSPTVSRNCLFNASGSSVSAAGAATIALRSPTSLLLVGSLGLITSVFYFLRSIVDSSILAKDCTASSLDFSFSGLAIASSQKAVCFGVVNLVDLLGLVSIVDPNQLASECSMALISLSTFSNATMILVSHSCVHSMRMWSRTYTAVGVVLTAAYTSDTRVELTESGGCSATAPSSTLVCLGCTLRHVQVVSIRLSHTAAMLVHIMQRSSITDSEIRDDATRYSSESSAATSLLPAHLVESRDGFALQVVSTRFVLNSTATAVPLLNRTLVDLGGDSTVTTHCASYGGQQLADNDTVRRLLLPGVQRGAGSMHAVVVPCEPGPHSSAQRPLGDSAASQIAVAAATAAALVQLRGASGIVGVIGPLQASMAAIRMRGACRLQQEGAAAATAPGAAQEPTEVGEDWADNPIRVQVGGPLAYAAGTVIGNILLVAGGAAAAAAVQRCVAAVRRRRGRSARAPGDRQRMAQAAANVACALYCVVVQPVAAAAVAVVLRGDGVVLACGALGVAAVAVPLAGVAWVTLRRFPLRAVACRRRWASDWLQWLVAARWRWVIPLGESTGRSRAVLRYLRALFEPYGGERQWVCVLELVSSALQGCIFGVASLLHSEGACDAVDASLWTMLAVRCCVLISVVALRPYAAMLTALQSGAMNAASCAVVLLSVLHLDGAAEDANLAQSAASVCFLLAPLVAVVLERLGILQPARQRRELHSSSAAGGEGQWLARKSVSQARKRSTVACTNTLGHRRAVMPVHLRGLSVQERLAWLVQVACSSVT